MNTLIETYQGRTATLGITDLPYGLGLYNGWNFINRANAESLARRHPETWRIPGFVAVPEKQHMSFLSVFKSIFHVLEAAAVIAAPVIAAVVDPKGGSGAQIAGIMTGAVNSAVGIESIITDAGKGQIKADVVTAQTKAVIDVTNQILVEQGKPKLPDNTGTLAAAVVKSVVDSLNVVATTVAAQPAVAKQV